MPDLFVVRQFLVVLLVAWCASWPATAIGQSRATAIAEPQPDPSAPGSPGSASPKPNILLVIADDQPHGDFMGLEYMPILRERFLPTAVNFTLGFATNPSCCPMRASLLTGGYPRRHGTESVAQPLGGAKRFRTSGADRETVACWLQNDGYITGLFGKYLNGYQRSESTAGEAGGYYVPPCWNRWRAMASPEEYGGAQGGSYEIVAWDSDAPTPVCRDFCPSQCRRCANQERAGCAADADCRTYGGSNATCSKSRDCCGHCATTKTTECNDDSMCPRGEKCRLGCRPTEVYRGYEGVTADASDADYSTDLLGKWVREFISDAHDKAKPFFAVYSPYAGHVGKHRVADPAARHMNKLADIPPWRPPSFNEPDVSDKPRYIQTANVGPGVQLMNGSIRQRSFEALLALDEQMGFLLDELERLGLREDTVVAYVSDNGVCYGEHRWFDARKEVPYECAIKVPILMSYPRRQVGTPRRITDKIVLLQDIPVTFADLAGVRIPIPVDGMSLAPFLFGQPVKSWRRDALLERWAWRRGTCLKYRANPRDGDVIRLDYGDRYLFSDRPSLLFEWDSGDGVADGRVAVPLAAKADQSLANLQQSIASKLPNAQLRLAPGHKTLYLRSKDEAAADSFYFWEEIDSGDALEPCTFPPDFYGIRDERGYTYVEYNDGERELYDLTADPDQLDNVHGQPHYQRIEGELHQRLQQILSEVPRRNDPNAKR